MIEKINASVLTKWKFDYDGYYWTHPNVPFKLNVANGGDSYYVTVDERYNTGKVIPPMKNTCELFLFISGCFDFYVTNQHRIISTPEQLQEMMDEYLNSFNPELKSIVIPDPNNGMPHLKPGNEFTYTLITGVECEFIVTYQSNEDETIKTDTIIVDPRCISNNYLLRYFNATKIISVKAKSTNGEMDFFGLGIWELQ